MTQHMMSYNNNNMDTTTTMLSTTIVPPLRTHMSQECYSSSSLTNAIDMNNTAAAFMQCGRHNDALPFLAQSLRLAKIEVERLKTLMRRTADGMMTYDDADDVSFNRRSSSSSNSNRSSNSSPFLFLDVHPSLSINGAADAAAAYCHSPQQGGGRQEEQGTIFRKPIVIDDRLLEVEDSVDVCPQVMFCILFNTALSKHACAISTTTRQMKPRGQVTTNELEGALQLYELAYRFRFPDANNSNDKTRDFALVGMIAILHNVSMIHNDLQNVMLLDQCRNQLVQNMMRLVVSSSPSFSSSPSGAAEQHPNSMTRTTEDSASRSGMSLLQEILDNISLSFILGEASTIAPAA